MLKGISPIISPELLKIIAEMGHGDELVLAAKGSGSSSIRDKTMFMGTSQFYIDLMGENTRVSNKLGQISRIQGGAQDYLAALDKGECDLVLVTESAVDYFNTH